MSMQGQGTFDQILFEIAPFYQKTGVGVPVILPPPPPGYGLGWMGGGV